MAKVSLRSYNQEIGTMIDQGAIEEAVGHCNHILKTFPKHLETYQLLGKAYLEAKRYQDASDVFIRLLASVPNDFVAHVGMSMIGDETNRLDEAIWHMERAFESQPSNAAVQSELQRLYGRRDGVQPAKIRMTSGALANVYVQGELYTQAVAEIMSVETQDPGRMDMKVLLAMAYFRSGQRVEASKVASDILAKSPFCLDANRILVEILPETSRADSAQTYQQRVNALDPYAAFAKTSIFNTSDVTDNAVNLERLDWQPGDTVFDDTGSWGDSSFQSDQGSDAQPDWLKNADTSVGIESAIASEQDAEPADDIPDFMRAAGWGTSSGTAEEPTSFFDSDDEDDEEPIAQAELPDWMKNIAPDQAELESAANEETDEIGDAMADEWISDLLGDDEEGEPQETSGADADFGDLGDLGISSEEQDAALNWLEGLAANQGANPEELITDPDARTENAPDWVQKAQGVSPSESSALAETPAPQAEIPSEDDDDMAWLNDLVGEESPEAAAQPADDTPDWLNDVGGDEFPDEPASKEDDNDDDDDMAWMKDLSAESEEIPEPAEDETPVKSRSAASTNAIEDAAIGTLGTSSEEQEAALNWLESLAANQGANPEELITDPNTRTEAAPDWVQQAQDASEKTPAEPPAPLQEEAPTEKDEREWLNELGGEEETPEPAIEPADDLPEWMSEVSSENTPFGESEEDLPEWLRDEPTEAPASVPPASAESESVGAVSEPTIGELGTSSEEQDAAMNWLESLAANQGANPEELITGPNTHTEAAPNWVQQAQDASESTPVEPPTPPQEEVSAEDDETAWMNELGGEETSTPIEEPVTESTVEDEEEKWLAEQAESRLAHDAPAPIPDSPPASMAEEETISPPAQEEASAPADNDTSEWPKSLQEEQVEEAPAESQEEIPEWLSEIEGSDSETRSSETSDDLPDWLKEDEAPTTPPTALEPTKANEWKPVVEEKPAPPSDQPTEDETPVDLPPHRELQFSDTSEQRDETLMSAQAALQEGNISDALAEYGKLVKKKRLLDETIYDLKEALYEYPVDISIWQMLGDAYMRAGRLQEAINAYTKAEELLR